MTSKKLEAKINLYGKENYQRGFDDGSIPNLQKLATIEHYCRTRWEHIHTQQQTDPIINLDYTDGLKQAFREIIDGYFGGL